jgi:hypothetical protein|tara:strand:+ start:2457 stop:2603 length:147 start_codon:yes stop_codon:yes gene_type:complete
MKFTATITKFGKFRDGKPRLGVIIPKKDLKFFEHRELILVSKIKEANK